MPHSKQMGEILAALLENVINGEIENNREALLKKAEEIQNEKSL
ncbi:MAG: hypothetical protein IJD80_05730 [Oscillospiraceae bacterium]|nr:hypothetical protein [Oscillospiraceae bacterium]